jgi:alpha-glucosidase
MNVKLLAGMALAGVCAALAAEVRSPDGNVTVAVEAGQEALVWHAAYKGKPVLLDARLGMSLYSGVFRPLGHNTTKHESTWRPVYGERSSIPDNYNELVARFEDNATPYRPLEVTVRAYNEGFALRYRILGTGTFLFAFETTEFRFPKGAQAWEEHGTEGEYRKVPVEDIKSRCERPLTVELGGGRYAAVVEAANTDYPGMLLSPVRGKAGVLASDLGGPVEGTAPYATPWRLVLVGERPGDLLEHNYVVLNLNPPVEIEDTSWIKPGKAIREVTLSTEGGKAAVDFAVARGLQYVEYDAGWYGHEYDDASGATHVSLDPRHASGNGERGGLDLPAVIEYAKQKGIGVFLYVNRRALERQADQIFPLYEKWGVKGVKFGFVNVGPQQWTAWLHETIRKAAGSHLLVDVHDGHRPSGFSRTYPNLLTVEGVRGNEHMPAAQQNATLPFTRFLAGQADYTPCYFSRHIQTTRAHQLALAAVYYSPLEFLYWYDEPKDYHGEPELDFWAKAPTVWDDTKVVDGRIGEFITVARRSGNGWFVGSIAGGAALEVSIPLAFLTPGVAYTAYVYEDGATKTEVVRSERAVDAGTTVRVKLPAGGGHAMRIVPVK